jgi:hypothetical protein
MRYTTDGSEFESREVQEFSLPPFLPDQLWGTSYLLSNGYRDFTGGIKRQKREDDRWPPASVEVKNPGTHTYIPRTSSWC